MNTLSDLQQQTKNNADLFNFSGGGLRDTTRIAASSPEMWRDIFTKVMADAPWVPVFNEQRFTIRSPRIVADDALLVDPVHIPVHYDYIAVK